MIGNVITISDPDELILVDQGAYTHTVEFDVQAYLASQGLQEIPEQGITLYLHTWVEAANGDTVTEVETSDNDAKVVVDNLGVKYNNNNVLLTMEQTNSATQTSVELTMQNMNMDPVASGNVMLNLLDADGNVVETKYLVTTSGGLLSFSAEEKKTEAVQFSQSGHSVQAVFFQQSADVLDATLSTVTLSGIALNFDPGQTVYSLQASDLKNTNLVAVASNSEATVSLLDGEGNVIRTGTGSVAVEQSLLLSPDGALNEFTITVDPVSAAGTTMPYSLAITNTRSSKPQLELLVKGTKGAADMYAGDVELALTSYDVAGFAIDHAKFKVNDGDWEAADYDGTAEQRLATVSEEGSYEVMAKVVLESGQTYELAPAKFDIMPAGVVVKIPDAATSSTIVSKTTVTADGKDQATVTVRLKDVDGIALSGRKVTLSPVQVSFVSDVIEPNPGTNPDPGTNPMPKPSTGSETDSTTSEPELEPDNDLLTIFKKGLIASEELLRLIQERLQSTADLNPEESFTDIENHWARQFIDLLVRLKVINGYSDGTFKPNNSITRAEFATMLARLIPFVPTDAQPLNFEDVQEGYWAQASIDLLTSHGIIKGYTDGTFKPNDTITREEMTVMLMRLLEGTALPQAGNVNFEDSSMVAAYARDSIMMAAKAGIIQGNKNIINPKGNASRAEVATMLIRLLMLDPRLQEILES